MKADKSIQYYTSIRSLSNSVERMALPIHHSLHS